MGDNADHAIFQLFGTLGDTTGPQTAWQATRLTYITKLPTPHIHMVRRNLRYSDDHLTVQADAKIPHGMTEHADLVLILRLLPGRGKTFGMNIAN